MPKHKQTEEAATPSPAAVAPDLPYTVGEWCGFPQWRCRQCPWDTLEGEVAVLAHITERHYVPPPKPLIQAYDVDGNPIEFLRKED